MSSSSGSRERGGAFGGTGDPDEVRPPSTKAANPRSSDTPCAEATHLSAGWPERDGAKRRATVESTPVLVGRETELSVITSALNDAQAGRGSSVCFTGPPGIGKTSLLDAAEAAAAGFRCLRATGVPGEFAIGHAALADIVTPLRPWLSEIPPPQRAALESALGWSAAASQHERFLVSAATLSLLSVAAQQQPVLVLIDDLQWIDPESLTVLLFVARRIGHDAVAILMARRDDSTTPELAGINAVSARRTQQTTNPPGSSTAPNLARRRRAPGPRDAPAIPWPSLKPSANSRRSNSADPLRCRRCSPSANGSALRSWPIRPNSHPVRAAH